MTPSAREIALNFDEQFLIRFRVENIPGKCCFAAQPSGQGYHE
jgi:hypothetical protein